jgi:hypothetical protein
MLPEDELMVLIVLLALAVALYVAVRLLAGPPDYRSPPAAPPVPSVTKGAVG